MRQGITPVVAIVLLLMMTVAAAGGAYAWMGQVQGAAQDEAAQGLSTRLDVRDVACGGGHASLYIKNSGDTEIAASDTNAYLYEEDELLNDTERDLSGKAFTEPGGLDSVFLNFSAAQRSATGYTVELAFADASLTAECTTASQRTCEGMDLAGFERTGTYTIDPDGPGGVDPFDVTCEMDEDGGGWVKLDVFEENPKNTNTPQMFAVEHDCGNGIEDGANDVGTVSGGYGDPFQHYDSVGGDSEFNTSEPLDQSTSTCPDWSGTVVTDLEYRTAGRTLSDAQMDALRSHVTRLSETTEMSITTTDVDEYEPEHDIWVNATDGTQKKLTPRASGDDADYRWTHERATVECGPHVTCADIDDALEPKYILPTAVESYTRSRGGGVAWWYREPYALVK